jgi:hypothetical protein
MLLASDYPLLGVLTTLTFFFIWVVWLITLFHVIGDIFRSRDLTGIAKAVWLLWVLVTPIIGVIAYVVIRGDDMSTPSMQARRANAAAAGGHLGLRG